MTLYQSSTFRILAGVLLTSSVIFATACSEREKPTAAPPTTAKPADAPPTERVVGPLSQQDADDLATMNAQLGAYVDLHTRIEATLPAIPAEATPIEIDKNQRELEKRVREARATAKQGDIFTAKAQPVIRRLLATVFGGPEGKALKASIMDENETGPRAAKLVVNARYPDTVPLTTIPPQVLQTLPKLTEDLEYRFIGNSIILLDVHAHLVADFIEDVFPQ